MRSGFSRKRVYQCSYGRASAYVGGQNLLTSDVIYQLGEKNTSARPVHPFSECCLHHLARTVLDYFLFFMRYVPCRVRAPRGRRRNVCSNTRLQGTRSPESCIPPRFIDSFKTMQQQQNALRSNKRTGATRKDHISNDLLYKQ